MPFVKRAGIDIYQFETLGEGVIHGVFTRHGGVSPEPWASLNLGGTVGDEQTRVRENKRLALRSMGLTVESIFDVWQVHGTNVVIADYPHDPETPHIQADAILTDHPGITLLMRFADCVPIFLHDPMRKVIGIAHAGWLGTVRCTVREAVKAMQARFGSNPGNIRAAIGPSIGPDHYEIGPDVVAQIRQSFGNDVMALLHENMGSTYFDLWAANRLLLERSGVKEIEVSKICTACHIPDWYSHRAEKGRTGRFGAVLALGI